MLQEFLFKILLLSSKVHSASKEHITSGNNITHSLKLPRMVPYCVFEQKELYEMDQREVFDFKKAFGGS
jgi:hypothetical protein